METIDETRKRTLRDTLGYCGWGKGTQQESEQNWLFKIYVLFELSSYFFFCLGNMKFYIAVFKVFWVKPR